MGPNRYLIQSIDVIKVLKCKYWAGQWIIVPPNPLVHLKDRVFFLLAQIEIYTMEDDIFTYGMRLQSLFYFILFQILRQKVDMPASKHTMHLTSWQVFRQVEKGFHIRESHRQPLPWDLVSLHHHQVHKIWYLVLD